MNEECFRLEFFRFGPDEKGDNGICLAREYVRRCGRRTMDNTYEKSGGFALCLFRGPSSCAEAGGCCVAFADVLSDMMRNPGQGLAQEAWDYWVLRCSPRS